jgi:hypothetical protein
VRPYSSLTKASTAQHPEEAIIGQLIYHQKAISFLCAPPAAVELILAV